MKRLSFLFLPMIALLSAQQPAPPPPEDPGSSVGVPGGNLDLSKLPVPEADRKNQPKISAEEAQTKPVMISVVPLGAVPPPIIYLDEDGMPREKYREPLEYPPTIYHIATKHGTIRFTGAQNQISSPTAVPRRAELELSYELPPGEEAAEPGDSERPLKMIGSIAVPPEASHLVVVLWKDPEERLWRNPEFKVIDVSPEKVKAHEAMVFNASGRELAIERGDAPYKIRPGFMGKIALPVNQKGEMPMMVAAAMGVGWHQLSRTVIGPGKDERVFVLAWQSPESPAQPSGVSFQAVAKRLPEARPLVVSGGD
jgi:hypothetical protein